MKACSRCHEVQPLSEFKTDRSRSDGKHPTCKACHHAHYRAHAERICAANRERYALHADARRAYAREYQRANKTRRAAYRAGRRAVDTEQRRKSRAADPTKHRAALYRRYWADPIAARQRMKEWRQRNHARWQTLRFKAAAKRRAAMLHPASEVVDRHAVIARDQSRCHVCGAVVPPTEITLDHLIPLARGGPHAAWNVAVAHRGCNSSRGVRGPAQPRLPI